MGTLSDGFTAEHTIIPAEAGELVNTPAESASLVVTSPPYPMIEMWDESFTAQNGNVGLLLESGDGDGAFEEMHLLLDEVWRTAGDLLVPGGFFCVNVGDALRTLNGVFRLYSNAARITRTFRSMGFHPLPGVVWRKSTNAPNKFMGSGMLPGGAYITLEHEHILVFRKGPKRVFDKKEGEVRRRSAYFWEERNQWFSDLWEFSGSRQLMKKSSTRERSAAFPLELAYRLICMYSLQGELVVDPFLGTGTTSFAAAAAGRSFRGTEIDTALAETVPRELEQRFCPGGEGLDINTRRLDAHKSFIEEYRNRKGEPRYLSRCYGFPVITAQEQELALPEVRGVERHGMSCRFSYSRPHSKPQN